MFSQEVICVYLFDMKKYVKCVQLKLFLYINKSFTLGLKYPVSTSRIFFFNKICIIGPADLTKYDVMH